MSFDIDIGFASVAGKRPVNEDFALAWLPTGTERQERGLIAAVADGVSTGGGGREAAQAMVTGLFSDWMSAPVTWETSAALDRIVTAHNAWLYAHNRRGDNGHERATTLTAVVARGQTWTVAHVGDSRAYLIRGADVEHLTTDHARPGDLRAALTRALGIDERVLVDYAQGELRIHDVLLLATDGAWSKLRDRDLAEAVGQCDSSQEAAERLTQLALARGSTDNVTVLVLRVRGLPTDDLGVEMLRARQLAVPRRLRPGEALDGLVVLSVLAQSDVTLLYQVEDQADGRQYVLKTLAPGRQNDDDERANLAHEAWLGQRFDSAAFVRVRPRPDASSLYVLFDWHGGRALEQRLVDGAPLSVPEAIDLSRQLLRALGAMHRRGVIHRDIKPANLHVGDDGVLRILDLGVAVSGNEPAALLDLHAGTPSYINPEQWNGVRADAASDLFASGVTLYRALTGKLPYGEVLPYQSGRYRRDPKPVSTHRPDVPKWLDAIILKSIALDPASRFETAEEFLVVLERGSARPLPPPRPTPLLAGRGGWQLAFAVSLFVNLCLLLLVLIVGR